MWKAILERNEEVLLDWVLSKLEKLTFVFSFSYNGMENDIMDLFRLIKKKEG